MGQIIKEIEFKAKRIIAMMKKIMNIIVVDELFLVNREYKENIGALYKGCSKESNMKFRFKERFKKKNGFELVLIQKEYVEAI